MILRFFIHVILIMLSFGANAGMAEKFCKLHYERQAVQCDNLLSNNSTINEFFYKSWSLNHSNGFNQASNFEIGELELELKNNIILACREGSGRQDLPIFRARGSNTTNETTTVKYRIDVGSTFTEEWLTSTDGDGKSVIFPIEAEEFLNRINHGKILTISYKGTGQVDVVSTFNLEGILELNDINGCI